MDQQDYPQLQSLKNVESSSLGSSTSYYIQYDKPGRHKTLNFWHRKL